MRYVRGQAAMEELVSYEESIRHLRNSILLAENDGPIRSV